MTKISLKAERLEMRHCLTAFGFAAHAIDLPSRPAQSAIALADLDGDADLDLLTDSSWRENRADLTFGAPRPLFSQGIVIRLFAEDFDGDGDQDVVASSVEGATNSVAWFENLNGRGLLGPARTIASFSRSNMATSIQGLDVDGDGDADLLVGSIFSQMTQLFKNEGRGDFVLAATWNGLRYAASHDVDHDGDVDVVGSQGDSLVLLENRGAGFESKTLYHGSGPLIISDRNDDGVVDVILAESTGVQWYELDPAASRLQLRETIQSTDILDNRELVDLVSGDFDGDGDEDLAVIEATITDSNAYWLDAFQLVGASHREVSLSDDHFASGVFALADANGDGLDDIVYGSAVQTFDPIRNQFLGPVPFAENGYGLPGPSQWADLDGDGDLDAILSSWSDCMVGPGYCYSHISWHENLDGRGQFGPRNEIWEEGIGAEEVIMTADVDADGDLDVLWNHSDDPLGDLFWAENLDGRGVFGIPKVLLQGAILALADIDQDGQVDLLTKERTGFVAHFAITDLAHGDQASFFAVGTQYDALRDWDQDGDLDVVVSDGRNFLWYENRGSRTFAAARVILAHDLSFAQAFHDVDADGDLDYVWTPLFGNETLWVANLGPNHWGPQQAIANGSRFVDMLDIDSDGDLDLLSREATGQNGFYLNDGRGNFTKATTVVDYSLEHFVDMDQDGDLDALGTYGAWYEQRSAGDANGDGNFNSADLISIFQAGEFEDWISDNSTFQTGDWNGDGDFNSSDLIMAVQAGLYEVNKSAQARR